MIHFGNNNFTVTLEWSQVSGETYTVATTPEAEHTRFTANTSVQLVMLYNMQYNVNITATLCGHRNATNFTVQYSKNSSDIIMASYYRSLMPMCGAHHFILLGLNRGMGDIQGIDNVALQSTVQRVHA